MTIKNYSKQCLMISAGIMVLALLLSLFGMGINVGIDFSGGMSMQYTMGEAVTQSDIEGVLNGIGLKDYAVSVQGTGKDSINIRIKAIDINNTIIIFDRIRENARKMPSSTPRVDVVNRSIKECLGRTINTTLTTLVTIVCLYIFGVSSIREFALPIIVGIISGVYSANMINGYVWAFLEEKKRAKKAAKA